MSAETEILDVREDIRSGREPFSKIMAAAARLRPDKNLLLLAPFEPKPLFAVLAKQGFSHSAREIGNGDWEVIFSRNGKIERLAENGNGSVPAKNSAARVPDSRLIEVDARRLEPPQPMVKILETLNDLPDGATICARTDRRPMHLYAQLESRGFTGRTEEQNDGSFITHICRS
jgi:uncharacterized protein (DUF2249 family)